MHRWKLAMTEVAVIVTLVALSVAGRLLWHPAQVAPVAAAALLAGVALRSRWLALCVPLASMAISDVFIGGYNHKIMAAVYFAMCLPVLYSTFLKKHINVQRLAACSLASSVGFFVISNGAEWMWGSLYSHDAEGLERCFTLALPFFRNTLIGDLLWTSILFAAHGLLVNRLRVAPPEVDTFDTPVRVRVRK